MQKQTKTIKKLKKLKQKNNHNLGCFFLDKFNIISFCIVNEQCEIKKLNLVASRRIELRSQP